MEDPTHLRDSFGVVLAKIAGREDKRYAEALALLPPTGAKPFLPERPIDLNGTWQSSTEQGPTGRITLVQKEGLVDAIGAFGGAPFFAGWYLRNPTVVGSGRSKGSTIEDPIWVPETLFIENADVISMNSEHITTWYYRVSKPAAHDLRCETENPFHVDAYYSWLRGRVALAANDESSARCWLGISADQGFGPGQSFLAAMLIRATPPDDAKAFQLATKSAAQGDIMGQLVLASLYREGRGTAPDAAKAQHWAAQAEREGQRAMSQSLNAKNYLGFSAMDLAKALAELLLSSDDAADDMKARKADHDRELDRAHRGRQVGAKF